jgi:hypothetical protein
MPKTVRVGDEVQLPSGRKVRVTAKGERDRPWAAVFLGRHRHVIRECAPGGNCLGVEHYLGGELAPMQLNEADATTLAAALNRATA